MKKTTNSAQIVLFIGLTTLFGASCLEEYGTVNVPEDSSSTSSGKASSSSTSSGDGGSLFNTSSSSSSTSTSGMGGMGGAGGSAVSSSSSSASSSSGLGGSGVCPACTIGTPPACVPATRLTDDCGKPGELCNGNGMCECGLSPTSIGICPAAAPWVPGSGSTCERTCNGQSACMGATFNCPAGFDCHIECSGQDACRNSTVNCPAGYACTISCSGQDACNNATINCSKDGPCSMKCDSTNGGNTCKNTDLICGDNSCRATCVGGSTPILAPNQSCSATGC